MRSGSGVRSATITVGREAQREVLARAVEGARAGQSACVLVIGEGGVGKTRLLQDAVEVARRAGTRAWRPPGRRSRRPPRSASSPRPCGRGCAGTGRSPCRAPFGHGLRLVLPEWEAGRGQRPVQRTAAVAGAGGHGAAAKRCRPGGPGRASGALLVLDDLHAADPDSVETIRYVASARVDGLAIVAALRPGESALADELVRALRGDNATTVVELEPLGHREVSDLVTHLLDAVPPAELVADVLTRTDGVPLFVEEVVDAHLRARSVVVEAGSAYWRGGGVLMPRSVRGMVTGQAGAAAPAVPGRAARARRGRPGLTARRCVLCRWRPPMTSRSPRRCGSASRRGCSRPAPESSGSGTPSSARPSSTRRCRRSSPPCTGALPQALAGRAGRRAATPRRAPGRGWRRRRCGRTVRRRRDPRDSRLTRCSAPSTWPAGPSSCPERPAQRRPPPTRSRRSWSPRGAGPRRWRSTRRPFREHGDSAQRRHRMASAALEAGYPDRARAALARADDGLPGSRVLASRLALVGGDAATALAEADAVLAEPGRPRYPAGRARHPGPGASTSSTSGPPPATPGRRRPPRPWPRAGLRPGCAPCSSSESRSSSPAAGRCGCARRPKPPRRPARWSSSPGSRRRWRSR